ncbi:hypothetical protein DPEC_G00323800 [Dallia pectoralis]|uniref:Uncharacterized protein n=1 Tax=Dallia pectoralis TaxID=75939 RepID=A0ACC2FAR6_DALPE|nr:hypothetical protein DPEC_G00323800 [Dallia pectoralis]
MLRTTLGLSETETTELRVLSVLIPVLCLINCRRDPHKRPVSVVLLWCRKKSATNWCRDPDFKRSAITDRREQHPLTSPVNRALMAGYRYSLSP